MSVLIAKVAGANLPHGEEWITHARVGVHILLI